MEYFGDMDVVFPYIGFQDFQKFFLVAEYIYPLSGIFSDFILEYPVPVFRTKHNEAFAFIYPCDNLFDLLLIVYFLEQAAPFREVPFYNRLLNLCITYFSYHYQR